MRRKSIRGGVEPVERVRMSRGGKKRGFSRGGGMKR